MDINELRADYDQLDKISVHIEPRSIPNPRYISEKIGECHVCIEQVEKMYIKANRELSLLQIAMNNAQAAFDFNRNELISNDPEISTLPSDRTKEAKANTRLKSQIDELSNYKRDIQSLDTLVKTISVKLKNLSRLNGDIRLQMRIMESQIKLGTGDINDPTTKNLMDELKKTVLGQDVWEGVESSVEESLTVDPSQPIDPKALGLDPMDSFLETVENEIAKPEVKPEINNGPIQESNLVVGINLIPAEINLSAPYDKPVEPFDFNSLLNNTAAVNSLPKPVETKPVEEITKQTKPLEEVTLEEEEDIELFPEDDIFSPGSPEAEVSETQSSVDLDEVLDFQPNIGGEQEQKNEEPIIIKESEQKMTQKEEQKTPNPNEMTFESLLGQFK